jgi:hypothetical protein
MCKLSQVASLLVCLAGLAVIGVRADAGVVHGGTSQIQSQPPEAVKYIGNSWWNDNGIVYHTPRYMATHQHTGKTRPDAGALSYHGGPVLTNPKIYLILWGYKSSKDPKKVAKLLERYFKAIGGSALENVATQYYGPGSVYITNPADQLGGIWKDDTNPIPAHPTDAQVAAEALASIAKFGFDPYGSYVVATGHRHSTLGFGSAFCASHSAAISGRNVISYTNLPYQPDAGPNCGAGIIGAPPDESSADEGVTIVEGRMFMDSITDPQLSAWWESADGQEIGHLCQWTNIQNDPMAGGSSYTMQAEYSDASSSCVHSYP